MIGKYDGFNRNSQQIEKSEIHMRASQACLNRAST
jgi:hypothetical protein